MKWTLILLAACGGSESPPADLDAPPLDAPAPVCAPTTLPAGQTVVRTLTFGGLERSYRVRLPAGYASSPVPLVLALHGGFGSGEQLETGGAAFDPIADREGFALVYPDGVSRAWNGGACCGQPASQNIDDVGFLTAVLDQVAADACIDPDRVYATGMSNGGIMSYRLACEATDRFAAIAPVAGTVSIPSCTPSRPIPVFHVHGTLDGNVPYVGGTGCGVGMVQTPPIPDVVATFAGHNGCTGPAATTFSEGNGTCVSSGNCTAETVLCSIDGGNHSWPGGEGNNGIGACGNGTVSTSFHASEAIWAFFKAHPRVH